MTNNKKYRWAVGCNIPGYMPDDEPYCFTNWQDARKSFIEDCERALDDVDNPQCYSIEKATLEHIRKRRLVTAAQTKIGDYIYWLTKI